MLALYLFNYRTSFISLMKLTISRKLMISYLAMALLTILASAYAIVSLQKLNGLAHAIINRDFYVLETCRKMVDTLFAQESAEKKYLILKDPSIADIFREKSELFRKEMDDIKRLNTSSMAERLQAISKYHKHYSEIFSKEKELITQDLLQEASELSDKEGRQVIDSIMPHLRAIELQAEKDIDANMALINIRGQKASRMTVILSIFSLISGFGLAFLITFDISKPIKKLERATGLVAQGQFNHDLDISRQDEIGSLARAFTSMTHRLKDLEALNLDASPLTGLPGNLAIEHEIQRRLSHKQMFSLCHIDLDNFKPFADRYGYAWGSEVIKEVADMLIDHVRASGKPDDFVGHIGGDDFVLASTPDRAQIICQNIVQEFDNRIRNFYTEKDRQKGYIYGKDRQGAQQKFPLITVTIAIVSDDGSQFESPLDMAKKAAELKELAKALPGSNVMNQDDVDKLQKLASYTMS